MTDAILRRSGVNSGLVAGFVIVYLCAVGMVGRFEAPEKLARGEGDDPGAVMGRAAQLQLEFEKLLREHRSGA